jgi:CO dehydrogenase maturation factor
MKIAVSGKGGVGKTTLVALLAHHWKNEGREVIVVDADPSANMASALGLPRDQIPVPISEMSDLIEERTGSKGGYGSYFKINPDVADIPEKFSRSVDGIRLLVLGGITSGGAGCMCPEGALLKALVTHLLLRRDQVVLLDMEAGVEHLGRATASAVSAMVAVVEPGQRSIETAVTVARLAHEIGIDHVGVVFNKVPPGLPLADLEKRLGGLMVLGSIPYDARIAQADLLGQPIWPPGPDVGRSIGEIADRLRQWT